MHDTRPIGIVGTIAGRLERRSALRLTTPFPALVRWRNSAGQPVEEEVTLDNLSAHGLGLRLARHCIAGDSLFVLVRFTIGVSCRVAGPGVAVRGIVVRAEPCDDGRCAIGMLFVQHRMVFAERVPDERNAHEAKLVSQL
jgi:hypothetical protein